MVLINVTPYKSVYILILHKRLLYGVERRTKRKQICNVVCFVSTLQVPIPSKRKLMSIILIYFYGFIFIFTFPHHCDFTGKTQELFPLATHQSPSNTAQRRLTVNKCKSLTNSPFLRFIPVYEYWVHRSHNRNREK